MQTSCSYENNVACGFPRALRGLQRGISWIVAGHVARGNKKQCALSRFMGRGLAVLYVVAREWAVSGFQGGNVVRAGYVRRST